jgi:DNA-binding FadR family transcriptional regulator
LETLPPEPDLCSQLNVSRTVLREAVKVLAAKGMVEVGPKVGTRVLPRRFWNLLDPKLLEWQSQNGIGAVFFQNICEVREIIEPATVELAAKRATKGEIIEIESALKDMKESVQSGEAFIAADLRFHENIAAASHNELFQKLHASIQTALHSSFDLVVQNPDAVKASLPLHEEVLRGIRSRNPSAARKAMVGIIRQAADEIRKMLEGTSQEKTSAKRQKHTRALG